jgi:hypothetical protein
LGIFWGGPFFFGAQGLLAALLPGAQQGALLAWPAATWRG